ncbi:MAG: Biotin biosynthesis cytochrome, partial [Pseudomonadota bacterium]
ALGAQAVAALSGHLRTQVERRRRQPGHTVLDLMIAAQHDDPQHDDDELLANLILLFIAGHETTTNWLGNGLLALLQHPQQLQRLRERPALMPTAVEEMLRWESPVNMVARTTVEPWPLGDLVVPPGEVLYALLGAANQDATAFADPDRFDIGRDPNPQVAFGGGVHYCVGAPLARLEATTAFSAILQRFSHLELAEDTLRWRPMINLRGLQRLRVRGRR